MHSDAFLTSKLPDDVLHGMMIPLRNSGMHLRTLKPSELKCREHFSYLLSLMRVMGITTGGLTCYSCLPDCAKSNLNRIFEMNFYLV